MFYTIRTIQSICQKLHESGHKIVLVTGFFDLLHQEHIKFLLKAKAVGDILIVAVESDERARQIKGEGRPVETQTLRCQKLLDLHLTEIQENRKIGTQKVVDYVITLGSDFNNPAAFESLISATKPNFLAVSSHTKHQDKKKTLVEKYGGQLAIVHDWNPSISTTQIIQSKKQAIISPALQTL